MTREQAQAIECMDKDLNLLRMLKETYEHELTEEGDIPDDTLERIGTNYEQILERFRTYRLHIKQEVGRVRTLSKKDQFTTPEATEAYVQAGGDIPMHYAPGAGESVDPPKTTE